MLELAVGRNQVEIRNEEGVMGGSSWKSGNSLLIGIEQVHVIYNPFLLLMASSN